VLKCVGSGNGSVILTDYEEGGHETQEEGIRKGTWSKPRGKTCPFFHPFARIGLHSLLPLTESHLCNLPTYPSQYLNLHTSNLKMEAACSSETLVSAYKTTRCHNTGGHNLSSCLRENHKTYIYRAVWCTHVLNSIEINRIHPTCFGHILPYSVILIKHINL
jgi:hypothetical protein